MIIGGGGGGGNQNRLQVDGNDIVDAEGQKVAVFTNRKDAIRYLRILEREAGELAEE